MAAASVPQIPELDLSENERFIQQVRAMELYYARLTEQTAGGWEGDQLLLLIPGYQDHA